MPDRRDALPIALTLVHAGAVLLVPTVATVALGMWWNANAISHQHTHRRFFRWTALDAAFSLWLSVLLGLPQRLWRARHLAHHAGRPWRLEADAALAMETTIVLAGWGTLAVVAPTFLLTVYLPGFALGLTLCRVHGDYEHRGGTTSCYGRVWNTLFLNDGYHVEHHAQPSAHPLDLPRLRQAHGRSSRWPPVLRFLDTPWLDRLEGLVLRCAPLRHLVLATHRRALRQVLGDRAGAIPSPRSIAIVGGGLFPRSAVLLAELFPHAAILVIDSEARHLRRAAEHLPSGVTTRCARYTPGEPLGCDLAILPLALHGDRAAVYRSPPAPLCLVHDWLWQPRGTSTVVAWWMLKRVNLVRAANFLSPSTTEPDPARRSREPSLAGAPAEP